jgi:hypothetical protein
MNIDDSLAFHTHEVVVIRCVRIEPPRVSETFDNIDDANFGKSDEGSIYRVKREARMAFFEPPVNHLCRGMIVRLSYISVNGKSLGRQPESVAAATILKLFEKLPGPGWVVSTRIV